MFNVKSCSPEFLYRRGTRSRIDLALLLPGSASADLHESHQRTLLLAPEIEPGNFSEEFREPVERELLALREYLDGPMTDRRFGGLVREREQYSKLFKNVRDERAIGEASVCYLWSAEAARNIRNEIPAAKIIMILRDPADRAFSQYLHAVTNGLFAGSFREMLQASLANRGNKFGVLYPFLELGMYSQQVIRYQELFPADSENLFFRGLPEASGVFC